MRLLCFFALELSIVAIFGGVALAINYYDRIVVALMRRFNIFLYPTAINIAMLIEQHPEQWSSDRHRLSHPNVGAIWIANGAYALRVETAFGDWMPNAIERRIIRNAVDWRIGDYLRHRIANTMQRNALGH